ncbi:hypothetical protein FKP32DRAFT_930829 [Trametes sanguinea]|nr:hypothetical protein FKP32DRAFT_930829 [Trametes sanguinea]
MRTFSPARTLLFTSGHTGNPTPITRTQLFPVTRSRNKHFCTLSERVSDATRRLRFLRTTKNKINFPAGSAPGQPPDRPPAFAPMYCTRNLRNRSPPSSMRSPYDTTTGVSATVLQRFRPSLAVRALPQPSAHRTEPIGSPESRSAELGGSEHGPSSPSRRRTLAGSTASECPAPRSIGTQVSARPVRGNRPRTQHVRASRTLASCKALRKPGQWRCPSIRESPA